MTESDQTQKLAEEAPEEERSFFKIIIHSFFIIPFLIAVFCVLLFAGIHLLTREQRSVYEYLEDVKTGGSTKRWQSAFELSRILANPELIPDDKRFSSELISAFEEAAHDDPRTRQYIALAMGKAGNIEFAAPLIKGLADERSESVPALIYALGMLKAKEAVVVLHTYSDHQDSRIRSIAVAALGSIAEPESKIILKKHLKDSEPNVQWGAAISLAQMDDSSGKAIISQMLDREYWSNFAQVDLNEQNNLVITAINVGARLNDPDLNLKIQHLAENDSNMKIRAAALARLDKN